MVTQTLGFEWEGLTLVGDLRVPELGAPHPLVVMMQGSGPADRNGNGYFPLIRDAYLARGIATFSFDKPGCGESTGDWKDHALEARAAQVVTAIESARAHRSIDGARIGLWGQSQGGWLAQMLASRIPWLSFAIANSGPSITLPEQALFGCEHSMRARGHSDGEIEDALRFVSEIHQAAQGDLSYDAVNAQLIGPSRGQSWYGYMTIDNGADWQLTCRFVNERYDPIAALMQIACPFLAIFGGRDVLVPAWQCARESGQALQQAGNVDATIVVFPDGNHRIQNDASGEFADGYLDLLTDWTTHRVFQTR